MAITDNSTSDATSAEATAVREALQKLVEAAPGSNSHATSAERIELLQQLLGPDVCWRLGLYVLPEKFVLSVVMPVYNEADTIQQIIERVQATQLPLELIIVDDGSSDGTRDVLKSLPPEPGVKIVLHERNQGKGAALKTGFQHATGDVVVVQDADMEYDPQDLRLLLQPILDNSADVVYGSRFRGVEGNVSPLWHLAANKLITTLFNIFHGQRFTDVETCYKMFRRELIQEIAPNLREKRFGIELEVTARLLQRPETRFYERPIRYARRSYAEGKKIGWRDGLWALWCILRY